MATTVPKSVQSLRWTGVITEYFDILRLSVIYFLTDAN